AQCRRDEVIGAEAVAPGQTEPGSRLAMLLTAETQRVAQRRPAVVLGRAEADPTIESDAVAAVEVEAVARAHVHPVAAIQIIVVPMQGGADAPIAHLIADISALAGQQAQAIAI